MCTIMTLSGKKFRDHKQKVIGQIRRDTLYNPHGSSLLIQKSNNSFIQLNTDDSSSETLVALLGTGKWKRFWLHTRLATTSNRGLTYTHGFRAGPYLLMHNGILRSPESDKYPVDSFYLGTLVETFGPEQLLKALKIEAETYANVFTVDTKTGNYWVTRLSTNSLFTDGKGNYSTNAVADVTNPVAQFSQKKYAVPASVPAVSRKNSSYPSYLTPSNYSSLADEQNTIIEDLNYLRVSANTFEEFAEYVETTGLLYFCPSTVKNSMTKTQLRWWNRLAGDRYKGESYGY